MYLDPKMQESIKKVELAREKNITLTPRRMTAEEKEELLKTYHPDYKEEQFRDLRFGPNKGEKVPLELADLLESSSRLLASDCGCSAKNSPLDTLTLAEPDYDTDVLIRKIACKTCIIRYRTATRAKDV